VSNGKTCLEFDTDTRAELHLLEHRKKMLEYLQIVKPRRISPFETVPVEPFSAPYDAEGYADTSISDDMVTDVFLEFSSRTRKKESEKYLRSITGMF
jgi:hypothetical protein